MTARAGENIHCNLYMDELEPYLLACGFAVKRNPKDRTGDRLKEAIAESNAWGADLHYVAHTNAGGGSYSLLMVYDQGTAYGYAEKLAARRREIYAGNVKISVQPQWDELRLTAAPRFTMRWCSRQREGHRVVPRTPAGDGGSHRKGDLRYVRGGVCRSLRQARRAGAGGT